MELEKKLGHKPNGSEIAKYGKHKSFLYIRVFGSLTKFYKNPRINAEHLIRQSLTKDDIIVAYLLLTELFNIKGVDFPNSIRKLEKVCYNGESLLKSHQIEHAFGNISSFLNIMENDEETILFKNELRTYYKI